MKKEATMPRDLLRTDSLVLALLGATALSAGNAVAQQQQPPAAEPQQGQQDKAQQTRSVRRARGSQARTRQAPNRPTIRCSSTEPWRFPTRRKIPIPCKVFRAERRRRQETYLTFSTEIAELHHQWIEMVRANTNNTLDFAHQALRVKSPAAFVEVSTEYARKQFETLGDCPASHRDGSKAHE
jgi:hypothetical protein